MTSAAQSRQCGGCCRFDAAAGSLETQLPGLASLSSAHAAVRSDDGLCQVHQRYIASYYSCEAFEARQLTRAIAVTVPA
jgi:hypothetical protein